MPGFPHQFSRLSRPSYLTSGPFVSEPLSPFQIWLVRLVVKIRLSRSYWKAFAPIHPLMLCSTSPKKVLCACSPTSPRNLPSFTVESTSSSSCSGSTPPLSCQGAALDHFDSLPPYNLVTWTDGYVPFPFCKLLTLWY